MIFRVPSYYNAFQCIADKCTDNCCIGWEIDVDSKTREYYNSVGGSFGKKLSENISDEDSFILQDERCPFLNGKNLCDIIINCGKEHLCQICRDHPRFFEWYGNIKEGGIGLSCEEGARLILSDEKSFFTESFTDEQEEAVDEALFGYLLKVREDIFELLSRGDLSFNEKIGNLLSLSEEIQFTIDNRSCDAKYCPSEDDRDSDWNKIIALYGDFEPVDESWTEELCRLGESRQIIGEISYKQEKYMLNLCRYFIWRYFLKGVFDEEILSKVKFAVVSTLFIKVMTVERDSLSVWIEKSKLYSKQMEYSDENRELFYDYCYEKECLSFSAIEKLII